jgi:DnaK suppressor protein
VKVPVKKPKAPVKAVSETVKPAKKAAGSVRVPPKSAAIAAVKAAAPSLAKKPAVKATPPVPVPAPAQKRALSSAKPKAEVAEKQAVLKPAAKASINPKVSGDKLNAGATPTTKTLTPSKSTGIPVAKAPLKNIPSAVADKKSVSSPANTPVSSPVAPTAAAATGGLLPRPPLKPGRRSSARTAAHMPPSSPMLPTHAPDAAKATYSTVVERVISPPPHVAAKKDPKLANNWKNKSGEELSDEEVKAMPDSEYMNDKQMAFFRHKLSLLKRDIHNSAGETTEHLREDTVVVPDPADRATIEEEHALELRTRDRERKLLKKIEQSIARIDSGDYGYCDETGEPIGVGRLIARPTASLSLEAQQRRELKQKMFGD